MRTFGICPTRTVNPAERSDDALRIELEPQPLDDFRSVFAMVCREVDECEIRLADTAGARRVDQLLGGISGVLGFRHQ
jgi:hypothetical protein